MSFSLYVHIPYCLVKCPYCDFNAYGGRSWPEERYLDALCAEFQHALEYVWQDNQDKQQDKQIETIYFGGGTPSLFAPASIDRFLTLASRLCRLAPDLEITLEADPASVTKETLSGFRAVGVNRLSLGVQSFQPNLLKTLGRLHTQEDALQAISWAREAGFSNLNIDIMFAVPGQTAALLADDLSRAFSCLPTHISIYNLTYEEHTPFFSQRQKGQLQPVDEDAEVDMYGQIQAACRAHGYHHYEISNFARPGFPSQHNTRYWTGESYLGLGAGAHSFAAEPDWGMRWSNERNPKTYMDKALSALSYGSTRSFEERLTRDQAVGEFLFLNLRQLNGFDPAVFADRFGMSLMETFPQLSDFITEGLMQAEAGRLKLTAEGLLVADTIFASFV
jgi:oxygen-independent coproporphyrinogen-3 oxidase